MWMGRDFLFSLIRKLSQTPRAVHKSHGERFDVVENIAVTDIYNWDPYWNRWWSCLDLVSWCGQSSCSVELCIVRWLYWCQVLQSSVFRSEMCTVWDTNKYHGARIQLWEWWWDAVPCPRNRRTFSAALYHEPQPRHCSPAPTRMLFRPPKGRDISNITRHCSLPSSFLVTHASIIICRYCEYWKFGRSRLYKSLDWTVPLCMA